MVPLGPLFSRKTMVYHSLPSLHGHDAVPDSVTVDGVDLGLSHPGNLLRTLHLLFSLYSV